MMQQNKGHKSNAMINALRNKRGAGVDLTIILGNPEDEMVVGGEEDADKKEQKDLGLAPDGTPVGKEEGNLETEDSRMGNQESMGSDYDLDAPADNMDNAQDEKMNKMLSGGMLGKGSMAMKKMAKKNLA